MNQDMDDREHQSSRVQPRGAGAPDGPPDDVARLRRRLARARKEVEDLQLLVNELTHQLADSSEPMHGPQRDLGYVFVMTYGRSGSTLVQGILNSIDGYLIRGENGGALHKLYRYHEYLMEQQQSGRGGRVGARPTDSWYGFGGYTGELALPALRTLVLTTLLRPESTTRVTGFKEIRWAAYDDLTEYVAFLTRLFPGARFVANTRNLDDVIRSKWWAHIPDASERLHRAQKRIMGLAKQLGDACFHLHYDDYVREPERLATLFDWLGEPFDVDRVRTVLDVRHGY